MPSPRLSGFEILLLIVGISAGFLGFQLINQLYTLEGKLSWQMITSIFNWLMLLVLFILLSITVDVSKKQLAKMEIMVYLLNKSSKKNK